MGALPPGAALINPLPPLCFIVHLVCRVAPPLSVLLRLIYVQIFSRHGPCFIFLSVNSDQAGATISDNLLGGNLINSSICLSVSIHLHVASGTNDSAVSIPIHSSFILMLSCTADAAVHDKAYGWALSMVLDDPASLGGPQGTLLASLLFFFLLF